jgi:hypothetical protein
VEAYKSVYAQKPEYWATEDTLLAETPEETEHGAATAHAGH